MNFKVVLSIAGFDGSGGAGIQADLKTFSAFGCYGMSILTALPIQNTCGVKDLYSIPSKVVLKQLETVFEDITPNAIKIGMLFNKDIIDLVATFLEKNAKTIPIVLDPVMVAKSGDLLLLEDAISTLKESLIPQCTIITPNLFEAQQLLTSSVITRESMPTVAQQLLSLGSQSVLLKGGHLQENQSDDLYTDTLITKWLLGERIDTKNSHGTGCTLSAAIASCLALGFDIMNACSVSKKYMQNAIRAAKDLQLGHGNGPLHHFYHLWPTINKILNEI